MSDSPLAPGAAFRVVHHRALNDIGALETALEGARAHPDVGHALEGDLCWLVDGQGIELYMRHPRRLWDCWTRRELEQARREGRLLRLEDVLARVPAHIALVIELKVGRGGTERAFAELAQRVKGRLAWVDGFSLSLLRGLRAVAPSVPLSLHAAAVLRGRVLCTPPDGPPRLVALGRLPADALTVPLYGVAPRAPTTAAIDALADALAMSGRGLLLGRLVQPEHARAAARSRAGGGYLKGPLSWLATE